MYFRLATNHLQQSSMKKIRAFYEMLGIHLFLSKLPLQGMERKLICSTKIRSDRWLPFMTRQPSNRKYQEHLILSSSRQQQKQQWAGWSFPFSQPTVVITWGGPGQGRALNVRVYVAALNRWPVSFPLYLHHKAFHGHSCPFCCYLCVNFYSIYAFTTH